MKTLFLLYLIVLGALLLFSYDLYSYKPLPQWFHLVVVFMSAFALMQWLFTGLRLTLWAIRWSRRVRRRPGGSRYYY